MASQTNPQAKNKTIPWFARGLFLLIWTGLFIGLMAYEWIVWPNGSSLLLGPFCYVKYFGMEMGTVVCFMVALPMLFAFPIRPSPATFMILLMGLVLWLFLGMLGEGIGC